jgi:transcriptional regulator with XRE-family HTH domain
MLEYRTGVHFTSWSKYEIGAILPGEEMLLKFAIALDLSPETWEELLRLRAETSRCPCDRAGRTGRQAHELSCRYSRTRVAPDEVVDEHNGVPATRYTRNVRKS